ncbi:bifunctional adenosylcobinamide kinase/adenosylcobinamide-phosphate guanylyltransferase [Azospirillum brasilense]|nr:bifunctional adenosylcobinamide kinase/adenosylcobinamide-phosphate guanylyltransferase [Azospirillum brasilense]
MAALDLVILPATAAGALAGCLRVPVSRRCGPGVVSVGREGARGVRTPGRVSPAPPQVGDAEMADRVARHKQDRGPGWTTVEEPLDLPGALRRHAGSGANVLVDCLTLWLSNLMMADADVPARSTELLAALAEVEGRLVLVSNEVGLGIVPDNALARRFRDHAGRLHQDIAAVAQRVAFVAAGLPLLLKGEKP